MKESNRLYYKEDTTNLSHFWLNPIKWRTTGTGMNQYVIDSYAPYIDKEEIILHIRENIVPYTDGRKLLKPEGKSDYFVDVVNECMKSVWRNDRGFVFTESQLLQVMMIKPDVNVRYSKNDGCYWCWK